MGLALVESFSARRWALYVAAVVDFFADDTLSVITIGAGIEEDLAYDFLSYFCSVSR
jgi:hypothetical protein